MKKIGNIYFVDCGQLDSGQICLTWAEQGRYGRDDAAAPQNAGLAFLLLVLIDEPRDIQQSGSKLGLTL
jgi:hypothetical protein